MKKKYPDVMIDIETLGRTAGCAVLSIGAVTFDRITGEIGDIFYVCMGAENAKKFGSVDPETMQWWMGQADQAKQDAFNGDADPVEAAKSFASWLSPNDKPWGNGSVFDITILEAWFAATGVKVPWQFWNIRDVRTVIDIADVNPKKFQRKGTYHNALDDAVFQVEYTAAAIRHLKEGI